MKLSKAQKMSVKVTTVGAAIGSATGIPLVFAIALLADLHSILALIALLVLPLATAAIGSVVGIVLFIVSTVLRVLLSK